MLSRNISTSLPEEAHPLKSFYPHILGASLLAQMVKNLPAMQETRVQSLGHEDPLEEDMTTHATVLAWEIPWTEEPTKPQSIGSQRVVHDFATNNTPR